MRILSGGLVAALLIGTVLMAADAPAGGKQRVYIGTYGKGKGQGIHLLELDTASGKLTSLGLAGETENPSFLVLHPTNKFLYAVAEGGGGGVAAFSIAADGKLTRLNQQSAKGNGPCHVTIDKEGKVVLVANYGSGSVAAIPVQADGSLAEPTSAIQHKGSSVNKSRQAGPHAHSINIDPTGQFAVSADLGLDQVLVYKLDVSKGTLTPHEPPFVSVPPGSGPRHFAFHPNGKLAFTNNEMTSTLSSFLYDSAKGTFTIVDTLSTLPTDYKMPGNSTAEVAVHPNGKFVYVSNRGHNSIAIFGVEGTLAKLTALGHVPTGGKVPRNFGIDPTGTFLLAANQDSDNVVAYRINANTGLPTATGSEVSVPKPVCVKFVK